MTTFQVSDMTCGSCAQRIRRALAQAGLAIDVDIDVATRQVRVAPEASTDDVDQVRAAIERAGYTPQPTTAATASTGKTGCCCARQTAASIDVAQGRGSPCGAQCH